MNDLFKHAILSPCAKYRYALYRQWDKTLPSVMFLMLNPSTADARKDDPTIRKCMAYAKDWGYGGIVVGNIYAFRSKDPKDLLHCNDPIGPLNDSYLYELTNKYPMVICAWGNNLENPKRIKHLIGRGVRMTHCLELTKSGQPKHPLYLRGNLRPKKLSLAI